MSDEPLGIETHTGMLAESSQPVGARFGETSVVLHVVLAALLGVGFALRLVASFVLTPHVDEAASVLAARVVADGFLPVLPSGNVYFQGFTLSLILSPLAWVGLADLGDLATMRFVSVIVGTAVIPIAYRFALRVTGHYVAAIAVAALVAVDPLSVQWSGHVRMYALLQLIAFGLAWVWTDIIAERATHRCLALGVLLGWLAVFTHSGASLLVGSILLAVLLSKGRGLLLDRRLVTAMAALGMAPIALPLLNRMLRPPLAQGTATTDDEGMMVVGDSLIRPFARFLDGSFGTHMIAWPSDDMRLWLFSVLPVAVGAVAGMALLANPVRLRDKTRAAVWYVSVTFWCTTLAFIVFTDAVAGRYLLHVYSVGYLLVPLLMVEMVERVPHRRGPALRWAAIVASFVIVVVMTASSFGRTEWRLRHPVVDPDYHDAMAYVAEEHRPGQPVVVALPPVAYLALGSESASDIYFLAGSEGTDRVRDYSRMTADGRRIDYWVGIDTIASAEGLRDLLLRYPDSLVVVDSYRLSVDWAYGGEIEQVIRDMRIPVFHGPGGVMVFGPNRSAPAVYGPQPDHSREDGVDRLGPDQFSVLSPYLHAVRGRDGADVAPPTGWTAP